MTIGTIRSLLLPLLLCAGTHSSSAADDISVDCSAEITANIGSGNFAPYYMMSNRHGVLTQPKGAMLRLAAIKPLDANSRFSWSAGVDFITGVAGSTDYWRYDAADRKWFKHAEGVAPIFIQQLYGEMKWRSLFVTFGMKQHESAILNFSLSSGDLTESGNSRPIPEARVGFIDFKDIPLTGGWIQIQGEIGYGKMMDNRWLRDHYNYYNYHITQGTWYNYKRLYLRTKPTERFSVTLGMQAAGQYGGDVLWYNEGNVYRFMKQPVGLKSFWKMLIPQSDGVYYDGNHLGSWDFLGRYALDNGDQLRAYFQWPWEDGSGIGKLNGYDGLWGLEWRRQDRWWITAVVVEYLDFMNQSGPIHWAPDDSPGTTLRDHATGGDQYYNNQHYNGYCNYGMSIGSPFLPGPVYNLDGYMAYVDNRVRGFHIGVSGAVGPVVDWRVLASYRKGYGDSRMPRLYPVHETSFMVEGRWRMPKVNGLSLGVQVAMDRGDMFGDNFGASLCLKYDCNVIPFKSARKP